MPKEQFEEDMKNRRLKIKKLRSKVSFARYETNGGRRGPATC